MLKGSTKRFFRNGVFILILCQSCNNSGKSKTHEQDDQAISIEKISLVNLNNQAIDLVKFKGRTIFINFWATWCKPCIEEMPSIQNAMQILKVNEIEFLFATEEDTDEVEQFKTKTGYDLNFVRIENMAELKIMGLPTTFIFNRNGRLMFSEMGYRMWSDKSNIDLIRKIDESK